MRGPHDSASSFVVHAFAGISPVQPECLYKMSSRAVIMDIGINGIYFHATEHIMIIMLLVLCAALSSPRYPIVTTKENMLW